MQDMYRHIPKLSTGFTGKQEKNVTLICKDFIYAGWEPNCHLDLRSVQTHYLEIFNSLDFLKIVI